MGSLADDLDPESLEAALVIPDHALFENSPTWTPHEVHKRYRFLAGRLMELMAEKEQLADELPKLEAGYNYKFARTRMEQLAATPEIRATDLKDIATVACHEEFLAFRLAEERSKYLKDASDAIKKLIGLFQSIGVDSRIMEGSTMMDAYEQEMADE